MTRDAPGDPAAVFRQYEARVNAGDVEGVAALFDENVSIPEFLHELFGGPTPADCVRNYVKETVIDNHGRLTTLRIATVDDWAYGVLELRSDLVDGLRVERIRGIDEVQVRDGKIVAFRFIPDVGDPQTRVFVEYTLRRREGRQ